MILRRLSVLLLVLCALACGACSSFERDWRASHAKPAVVAGKKAPPRDPFVGAWDGHWFSEKHRLPNGTPAGGRLRCIFTRIDASHYHARFHANWLVFATGYETTVSTKQAGSLLTFRGEQDLGLIFGGVYRYEGMVTPEKFRARFSSRFDHGTFDMARPAAAAVPGRLTR